MTVHVETPAGVSRLYERVARVIPPMEWPAFAADIEAIERLKKSRDAVILAHNYQTPEIFHCVADFVGDSLALAREATKVDARAIVMAGVHFMAETAKLINPEKTVLIPDPEAGCSLAEFDHGRGRAGAAPAPSRRPHRHLRQHFGGGEGGIGHLLHLRQRAPRRRVARRAARHHAARQVSGGQRRPRDEGRDHRVGRALRGARALHQRRRAPVARGPSRRRRARSSRVPARSGGGSGLRRLDRANVRLRRRPEAAAGRAAHRMLDERQRRGPLSRRRLRPSVQPLPAHEADHARQHPTRAGRRTDTK